MCRINPYQFTFKGVQIIPTCNQKIASWYKAAGTDARIMKLNIQSGQRVKECWHFQQATTERPCVSDVPSDTKRFLKKLDFPGGTRFTGLWL